MPDQERRAGVPALVPGSGMDSPRPNHSTYQQLRGVTEPGKGGDNEGKKKGHKNGNGHRDDDGDEDDEDDD